MECVLIFLLMVFLSVVFLLLAILFPGGFHNHDPLLRHIAAKIGGQLSKRGWFLPSSIVFRHASLPALFRIRSANGSWLELKIIMRELVPMALEVSHPRVPASLCDFKTDTHFECVQPLPLDAREDYLLRTDSQRHVDWFMNEEVLRQFRELHMAGTPAPIYISIVNTQLTILKKCPANMLSQNTLLEFIYQGLRLHDFLRLAKAEGITFVESPAEVGPVEQLKCGVCGEELGAEFVECRRCQAPHHLECWNYNGSCGTFACKETRYHVSPRSQPISWYRRMFPGS